MKQGKGTDVLGANDPRSDAIGVIYVSPNDDRKSVLAAILTQEKLGRKQVAVVLPAEQNKAFQRPGDFDELKTWRRKLQTQVVFIAAGGPGPAEFARQRRFLVYSSLENYADALRDETQIESASKKGWLFGSPRSKAESGPITSHGNGNGRRIPTEPLLPATQELHTPTHGRSTQYDSEEDEPRRKGSALPFVAGAALGGGAALVADAAMSTQAHGGEPATPAGAEPFSDPSHTAHDFTDDADALSPRTVNPARTPEPTDLSGPTQAGSPARNADAGADGGSIIELRPRRSSKATLPLTPREPAPIPATPAVAPESDSTTQLSRPKRSSGKIAAAGVGAVAGAAAVSAVAETPMRGAATSQGRASAAPGPGTVAPRPGGPGGIPPRGTPPGGGRGNGRGSANSGRQILLGVAILLLALLACGGIIYSQPKSFPGQVARSFFSAPQSPATITITPSSQTVEDTYTLVGANTTNAATREVAVRTITGAAQSPATPVKATGLSQHAAKSAQGTLTFFNALGISRQLNAGFSFPIGGGVSLVLDQTAYMPASNGPNNGPATVSAHAVPAGPGGNIGAYTLSASACCATNITVSNTAAFTGGQDAVNYAFLQQSDVNGAISQSIMNATKQNALNDLTRQLRTGEQFLGSTHCASSLQADEPVGDSGTNVNNANVSYRLKCTATAYDNQGAQNTVKSLLSQKANSTLGPGYVLVNNIQTSLTNQTGTKNTLSLFFSGKGVWAYQFSDAQKLQLAKAIAGKTVAQAQSTLKSTPGIGNATVNINGGTTLPANYNQISIVIQPIAGLGAANTAAPNVGQPTITGPTIQSGTPGANGKGGSAPPSGGGS